MQELKKVLDNIYSLHRRILRNKFAEEVTDKEITALVAAEDIIQNCIYNENGGWIPVGERLPTMEEYQKNDGRFILDDGNRRYQGLFDVYERKFKVTKYISGIIPVFEDDSEVIAWMPLPEPYRSKSKTPEERQEWKERMLRNFLRGHKTIRER